MPPHPVFVVDDTFFRSRTPPTPHWSIAWSDLMMTMFVLFLTLFVYQLAHRDFLSDEKPEVVAGRSMPLPLPPSATLPFHPISAELDRSGKRVLREVKAAETTMPGTPGRQETASAPRGEREQAPAEPAGPAPGAGEEQEPRPLLTEDDVLAADILPEPGNNHAGSSAATGSRDSGELITEIFDLSRTTLASEKLEKFASVELIPDKAMRIILTGDLLFDSGQAELTDEARRSLRSLAAIIGHTPYMINVVGHTDSVPMSSPRYPTNWELSTARACQVARFLMDEAHIPGSQIVVSGYSYFRPVRPNTTESGRRANRRVEIILSREPAPAQRSVQQDHGPAPAGFPETDLFSLQAGT